jgi:hypothetical protein
MVGVGERLSVVAAGPAVLRWPRSQRPADLPVVSEQVDDPA